MPWVRLDDGYLTNPKVLQAGRDGRDVHQACIFYCARELTDGFVPAGALPLIAVMAGVPDLQDAIGRCVAADLLLPAPAGFWVGAESLWSIISDQDYFDALRAEARRRFGAEVFARGGFQCRICGSHDDLTLDHIVPLSRGGRNEPSNLQALCRSCNSRKGAH